MIQFIIRLNTNLMLAYILFIFLVFAACSAISFIALDRKLSVLVAENEKSQVLDEAEGK